MRPILCKSNTEVIKPLSVDVVTEGCEGRYITIIIAKGQDLRHVQYYNFIFQNARTKFLETEAVTCQPFLRKGFSSETVLYLFQIEFSKRIIPVSFFLIWGSGRIMKCPFISVAVRRARSFQTFSL